ncbi:hypothetical protein TGPRC2_236950 [Toxoplasma gondii TgCatPRC2]|uniref:Uncharacterized protein n=15 Tax=Toxoplasma gondii TaxID=5811 RepID=B9PVX5_TOXGV|nr:hypothetical protein TGME49_236950 [Toxoplasma gondii ME49]EPR60252.1 hypothetical protein TGGT1_236950 [Toxoplasma gondii GT1]ESS31008.1 hypothetical protein TGVEG_236950 [Toxoplasma gondii VEG]KAF4640174.1 hypothetical protein TGRH88_040990 [Toxoplasma gondii]KFG31761.1 hypothetical protein TGDOM2_236950 [Toxoplasma gondii GAB2-2007-GAL-DOM2]KFG36680.1 hypothetical protein TGP89_236950 [Toxoplasma gondii p89]KFG44106.1 hypothetical protein TGFOU_236950 [Toxoplasma gondii FOU]KFG62393.1 |eukprot:XP_002369047.1 hypothetical protein TGME49_236950 [Toxoplasma gondii ME49]
MNVLAYGTAEQRSVMDTVEQMQHHQAAIAANRTFASEVATLTEADSQNVHEIYVAANTDVSSCEYFLQPQRINVPYYVAPTYESYVPPGGTVITHMPPQIKRMKKRTCCACC